MLFQIIIAAIVILSCIGIFKTAQIIKSKRDGYVTRRSIDYIKKNELSINDGTYFNKLFRRLYTIKCIFQIVIVLLLVMTIWAITTFKRNGIFNEQKGDPYYYSPSIDSDDSKTEMAEDAVPSDEEDPVFVEPGMTYTVRFGGYIYSTAEENDDNIMYYTSPGETLEIDECLDNYWYKVTYYIAEEGAHQGFIQIM